MNADLKQLEKQIGVTFKNRKLLKQAFTHSSYVNEHRGSSISDNERLEFLGDAVLELTISEFLYHSFPQLSEGELTKFRAAVVCEPSLVRFAEELGFGDYVFLGKGEEMTGGRSRPALLADVFESFVGALFLDQGLDAVRAFLQKVVFPKISDGNFFPVIDYKTHLQEWVQKRGLGTIQYRIVEERGPAHEREFVAEVYMDGKAMGRGAGRSKKDAEQQAAMEGLAKLSGFSSGA